MLKQEATVRSNSNTVLSPGLKRLFFLHPTIFKVFESKCEYSLGFLVLGPTSSWSGVRHICIVARASLNSTFKHIMTCKSDDRFKETYELRKN